MRELAGGLWTWTGRHPDWNDDPQWGPEVRSYALRTDDGVILFDPIAPPDELTAEGDVQVVLTADWHSRDAAERGWPIRGDDLPPQVTAQPAFFPGERTLWLPGHNALVAGDCLPNGGAMPDAWLESGVGEGDARGVQREAEPVARPACRAPIGDARRSSARRRAGRAQARNRLRNSSTALRPSSP